MTESRLAFLISVIDLACWPICFWWMHRISRDQNKLLEKLREESQRVKELSESEHTMVEALHPKIENIAATLKSSD